jgi:hypothetical protein
MKSFRLASIAAAALSGALFATSVTADLPPIVIKVRPLRISLCEAQYLMNPRDHTSSSKTVLSSSSAG